MIKKLAVTTLGLCGFAYAYDHFTQTYVFQRNLRTVRCGLNILYSYKIAFNETNCMDIHENIAKDIYETCRDNDGLYVKLGQGIATMDHLLPPPFYKWFSKLQDKAKASEPHKIKRVFEEEVGISVDEAFLSFEEYPIASASLAQVHRAILKDGRQVAVKIQKPNIKRQFGPDMSMHYVINWVLQKAFELPLLQFVDDIQKNLAKELDFRIEAENAKKGEMFFKKLSTYFFLNTLTIIDRHELHVPKIIDEFTRSRVMVSEWIDGIKVTDETNLRKHNFNQKQIITDIIKGFAEQIFVTGFIHCDPHPGNIFVRPDPKNPKKHQIVILDFGLCLEISDKFRREYAGFWKSMFLQDTESMKQICAKWGMTYSDQFSGMTLMRPYNANKLLTKKVDQKDIIKMQLEMKQKMRELMKQTQNFPKELLFISRNMNLVRSLNKFYGGKADRISIMAKTAYVGTKFTTSYETQRGFMYRFNSFLFSVRVVLLEVLNWILMHTSGKTIDEHIENETINQSKEMFEKYGFKPLTGDTYNS